MSPLLRRLPGRRFLRLLRQVLQGGDTRRSALLRLSRPRNLFQPFGTTAEHRYPGIFEMVRAQVGDGPERRVLSFGCATGEEVFSLRRHFARAEIEGVDISAARIAEARSRLARQGGDSGIRFAVAASAETMPANSFDAIFAMAVFRHGELGDDRPERCDHRLRFADFERTVTDLARCLKPGGLLAIRHANFRFRDTAVAAEFDTLMSRPARPETPVYGADDRLLPHHPDEPVVFRKRPS
ncbi:MAG: methyltransferase domain-containing protein [Alphaproteobacteria bacterium]|nr:methyltransferase domain-containing protein [Alphaproteobacteria bacterium]